MQSSLFTRRSIFRWLEPQAVLLAVVVMLIFFTRLGDLTLRGEETRRARVAIEMLETGDWIVPREQGRLFPDRPPLGNWLIALSMLATGGSGAVAVRLPTVLATLATSLVVYAYTRGFLGRNAALAAGLAYATSGQILQLGMLAETEATLTLMVGASLLLWHLGYLRCWPAALTWTLGYGFAALAALAKGPQGPIYFVGAAVLYLACRRDWRFLLCGGHALGLAVFAAIVAAWQVPYAHEVEWKLVLQTWGHTSAARFDYSQPWPVVKHLLSYPCEIAGCLLPWSIWLAAFANRDFRRALGPARQPAIFLWLAIAVAFPTCWLAPQARGRYFMPLYPCFAPLVAIVIDRAWSASPGWLADFWRRHRSAVAAAMLLAAAGVMLAVVWPALADTPLRQSPPFAAMYTLLASLAAWIVWKRPVAGAELGRQDGDIHGQILRPSDAPVRHDLLMTHNTGASPRLCPSHRAMVIRLLKGIARQAGKPDLRAAPLVAMALFLGLTWNGLWMNDL
ncbi:MAG TPA: glycosyltransferase family 39 protein, partial [Pirellulales bacterium]